MNSPYKVISIGIQPELIEIIKRQLSPKEYQIQIAEDFNQMKEILRQGIPDIVYMGLETREFDPFKVCLSFSKAGIAVIMVSETPTRELLVKAAKHGAIDLLATPLRPESVGSKIDRALIKTGKKGTPEGLQHGMDFGYAKNPSDKVKVLIKNVKELLALPFAVVKIIRLCNDPSSNARDIEKPVQSDPAVAAMIMQRANSAAYAGIGQTTDIQRAIMRIGLKATRNIAASFSVFKLFSREEKSFGFNRILFWVHSLTTGICAQVLATLLKYRQPDDAFIAGLLHDIGKMVLDDFLNEEFHKALLMANTEGLPMRLAEQSVFDTNHAYVGSRLARAWGFPSLIVDAIAHHHRYEQPAGDADNLSADAIVCLANQMAKALQAGSGGDHLAEREALPLWNRLPKGLTSRKIIEKILEELRDYLDVLEIPPEQFQMELPEEGPDKAGIFVPNTMNYGTLLQIALERHGLKPVLFSSLGDQTIMQGGIALVIGDLTSVEDDNEADQFHKGLSALTGNALILPHTDEKNRPFNLDFFWLESELNKALKIG